MALLNTIRRMPTELVIGAAIVLTMVAASILVPLLSPHDVMTGTGSAPLQPPSSTHLFGTDHLGRDVFVRAFSAARLDLGIGVIAVSVPFAAGVILGSVLGATRSQWVRSSGDVAIEAINAFPTLIIVIALVAAFGRGMQGILLGLFATAWARYAKVARGRASSLREMDYLEAARSLGYSPIRRLFVHVLPNVYRVTLSYAISDFVVVILAIAGLSFLGAGVQPPVPEWGAMMSEGRLYIGTAWWTVLFPGLLLTATAIGVALAAEGADKGMTSGSTLVRADSRQTT